MSPTITFAISIKQNTRTNPTKYHIKVAVLDNFTGEISAQIYKNAYFDGIKTAILAASEKGVSIETKAFTYGSQPLDILDAIPQVRTWQPDFIIGPHSSNQFLILKNHFKNIVVISPYATDEAIAKMPKNFYSLSLPDHYIAHATISFLEKFYPGRDIFNIVQADCKDCIDLTRILNDIYRSKFPQAAINNSYYTGNNIKNINFQKTLASYKPGSIIILQPISHCEAAFMMPIIANLLKTKDLIFIFNLDNWGDAQSAKVVLNQKDINFTAFRVSLYLHNKKKKIFQEFTHYHQKLFAIPPKGAVSYMTYLSVMAVVNAILTYPPDQTNAHTLRETILNSFNNAIAHDKNWYRETKFIAYTNDVNGEKAHAVLVDFN